MQTIMNHNFSKSAEVNVPRSTFKRHHGVKTTFDAGKMIPIFIENTVLPGDTIKLKLHAKTILATPIFAPLDNMFLETFFFYVPYRLLWTNFKKFMGEQTDPGDTIDYTIPQVTNIHTAGSESLTDYFGLPTQIATNLSANAWAYRAHNLIFNEWIRDQNLQDSLTVNTGDGPDSIADYSLYNRCKQHDYFTSCLPYLTKQDPVELPIGTSAPVAIATSTAGTGYLGVLDANTGNYVRMTYALDDRLLDDLTAQTNVPSRLYADLSSATASTVNELRTATQVQELLELNVRSGSRYTEIVHSEFGVTSPDSRLQRPEYLGGGSSLINITPIARTDSSPGVLGSVGETSISGHGFNKSFTEHGVIIGYANVRADLTYSEGMDRTWSDQTKYDLYTPLLAHLGEQAVLNKEIFCDGSANDTDVFGYQECWSHLRYKKSMITGKFRPNDPASLEAWHLSQEFGSVPTLDATFIQSNPPIDRIIAVPTQPHFIYDSYIEMEHTRPMPTYSIPGLTSRF